MGSMRAAVGLAIFSKILLFLSLQIIQTTSMTSESSLLLSFPLTLLLACNHHFFKFAWEGGVSWWRLHHGNKCPQIILTTAQPTKRCWTSSSAALQNGHLSFWGRPLLANQSAVQTLPRMISHIANLHFTGAQDFNIASATSQVIFVLKCAWYTYLVVKTPFESQVHLQSSSIRGCNWTAWHSSQMARTCMNKLIVIGVFMSSIQTPLVRAWATVLLALISEFTITYTSGAISTIVLPLIHLSVQKKVLWPLPNTTLAAALKRALSAPPEI